MVCAPMDKATTENSLDPLAQVPTSESHGIKVKRGQLSAVQQGRYGTGPAPYGYRRGQEGERPLEISDIEAEVVRTIFREYLRTRSTGKVVHYLHAKEIFTRKNNKWSRQAIAIILSNRTYRGRVTYGDVETQGLHPAIIEPALFYKANSLREKKRRNKKTNNTQVLSDTPRED
ncbi:MAG: hypothetical protein COA73_00105 [Candidatus Hydrogenedentota bacterium]|nr:MAG: hypothetical protein COA73_00105 [Candidatus Hydrogenedentota bacterium]